MTILVFVSPQDVEKTVLLGLPTDTLPVAPFILQAVIEKSVIFGLATGTRKGSAALSDLVTAYASLLASQVRRWAGSDAGGEAVSWGLRQRGGSVGWGGNE